MSTRHVRVEQGKWRIDRDKESVLWGRGRLDVHLPLNEGYRVQVCEFDQSRIDTKTGIWAVVSDYNDDIISPDNWRGIVVGEVSRKMLPEVSPDLTVVELERAELPDEDVLEIQSDS